MKLRVSSQRMPKAGLTESECEDAIALGYRPDAQRQWARFAIADGASESVFAKLWAEKAVHAYCTALHVLAPTAEPLKAHFHAAAREWAREVWSRPLPWQTQVKLEQGAFAAFLGLRLAETREQTVTWSAISIGDACLFVIRDDQLLVRFPMREASAFGSHPMALCTDPANNDWTELSAQDRLTQQGAAHAGDRFLLMTDALAHWFLDTAEDGGQPWRDLHSGLLDDPNQFAEFVDSHRSTQTLRNDDVAVVSIEFLDG